MIEHYLTIPSDELHAKIMDKLEELEKVLPIDSNTLYELRIELGVVSSMGKDSPLKDIY